MHHRTSGRAWIDRGSAGWGRNVVKAVQDIIFFFSGPGERERMRGLSFFSAPAVPALIATANTQLAAQPGCGSKLSNPGGGGQG